MEKSDYIFKYEETEHVRSSRVPKVDYDFRYAKEKTNLTSGRWLFTDTFVNWFPFE